jgi:hypothetical protein
MEWLKKAFSIEYSDGHERVNHTTYGTSSIQRLRLVSGNVTATCAAPGDYGRSGTGNACTCNTDAVSTVAELTILGENVSANSTTGGNHGGTGIGTGSAFIAAAISHVTTLAISNRNVSAIRNTTGNYGSSLTYRCRWNFCVSGARCSPGGFSGGSWIGHVAPRQRGIFHHGGRLSERQSRYISRRS